MSKYTRRELRDMARLVIQARDDGSPQYNLFLFQVSVRSGLPSHRVEQAVCRYAAMEVDE